MEVEGGLGSDWWAMQNTHPQRLDSEARAEEASVLGLWPERNVSAQVWEACVFPAGQLICSRGL